MKTVKLQNVKVSGDGKTATISVCLVDSEFSKFPVQRVTVGHLNPTNLKHPRHIQISNEAIFVKHLGNSVAVPLDDIVAIAAAIEPKTSFAPVFFKSKTPLTVEVSTELQPDFQWQVTDSVKIGEISIKQRNEGIKPAQPVWTNVEGQTTATLDPAKVKKGQWVRCIASSSAGSMTSNPVQVN